MLCLAKSVCKSSHVESPLYQLHNLTAGDSRSSIVEDASISKGIDHPHYVQAPHEYLHNLEELWTRSSARNQLQSPMYRNPHFLDLETDHKPSASVPNTQVFKIIPYQDHHLPYEDHEPDFSALKKHDFGSGHNFGWDFFPSGHIGGLGGHGGGLGGHGGGLGGHGGGLGGHGGGLGGLGGSVGALKKGKEAKTLFILMAPLILLAVFGPILATQAMIPWVANGGLTSVSTIAGGRRRKRQSSNFNTRQSPELEKRLQLFIEVQDFIARTGSQSLVQEMGEAFLQCQKYTERRNKCLERVACAYTDNSLIMDFEEKRIGRMVLRNVMSNPYVPSSLIGKLKKGFLVGKNHPGHCTNFWCDVVDNSKHKPK
ncbi:uncharacterized protein CDAR_606971 [Caerostris darwini]|uniref:Uncharacterized protein n=1 Tax=Caerostris darwini TaxID=1538125 RepID=A0AAV4R297_9ARAC|nr:uncharacterized protein CDAR_606971 [Caerostris darwini]